MKQNEVEVSQIGSGSISDSSDSVSFVSKEESNTFVVGRDTLEKPKDFKDSGLKNLDLDSPTK